MLSSHRLLRRFLCTASSSSTSSCPKPWLFIGLGNPGEKYQSTRHNVGFDMIDAFARSQLIPMTTVHCKALFGEGMVGGTPVLLAKPQTYMNLSGESMYDDMDLSCGVLRIQPKGGHGRHKGMKSVIYHFRGNREFGRLRIGIGRPPGQMDPKAFLLQKFNRTARERIDSALQEGVEILKTLVAKGLTECARSANMEQKYKHLRLQTLQE
ncbi:peptidyl-tRNA hydrolase, mitochondrial isoform X2 [Phoenix dactylifera]|uniref:Peptidyl-tRNA hydrolase, mitochondrial isoform X2 n=1 Tax=Phoenix dactylifera TaxID=42345 RepID=A0A8B8JBQ9_PHODC|nr:peptidyl-tRNA hydrolase, mitochondrial isoform X2 [Phoenix dactylifera]